ncbi:MAG: hypothetical protein FJ023_05490 [Chloroflexi bacterium]|nr:hypothetical protein [Chloroflexota bacterium]
MTYVGFLIETAFFAAIMTFNWREALACPQWMLVLIIPFWVSIHVFVRWQLRLRRFAALQVAAVLSVILKNLTQVHEGKTKGNNLPGKDKGGNVSGSNRRTYPAWIDFLIPCPSAHIYSDIGLKSYPTWYQEQFKDAANRGTGAMHGEHLVTWSSWLILIFMILRLTLL